MDPSVLLILLWMQDPVTPADPATTLEDVVVTTSEPAAPIDAFAFFRDLCVDGNRLDGAARRPAEDSLWVPMEDRERQALDLPDDRGAGYLLETERLTLVLRIEEGPDQFLRRHVCSLTIVGQHDQPQLVERMQATFHGPGTTRHLHYQDAYPTYPGWTQRAWSAIPARDDTDWREFGPTRRARSESGFVVVTEPSFFARSRYVVGEVRFTPEGPRPVSVLTVTQLFKP